MKNDAIYWIWYSSIPKISNNVKIKLLDGIESPREIFKTAGKCLLSKNISADIINKIAAFAKFEIIEKYIPVIEKYEDIGITTYYDYDYPTLLTQVDTPPLVLYYKGNIGVLDKRCISIVGTRNATDKGKYHARSFAREMAAGGVDCSQRNGLGY